MSASLQPIRLFPDKSLAKSNRRIRPSASGARARYRASTLPLHAVLLEQAPLSDPFAAALRRIDFESSRIVQAQTCYLKSQGLAPTREAMAAAVDRRHLQLRELWTEPL